MMITFVTYNIYPDGEYISHSKCKICKVTGVLLLRTNKYNKYKLIEYCDSNYFRDDIHNTSCNEILVKNILE